MFSRGNSLSSSSEKAHVPVSMCTGTEADAATAHNWVPAGEWMEMLSPGLATFL